MGVKVTGQFEPAGDFSIVDGKDVSGNITGSNISSSGQIEAASIGTNLGSIISGSTPFDRSDVSGSWRGALSGSLNIISGSSTSTGSFGNLRITGNSAFGDLSFDTFPYNSNSNSGQFITLKAQDTSDKAILELASANVSSGNVVGEIHFINRSSGAGFNPIANITSHFSQGLLFKTQYGNNGEKVGIRITEENNAPPEVIIPSGSLEVKGNISGSSTSTGSFGAGYIDNKLGIGISAPTHKLHALSTDNKAFLLDRNTGNNPTSLNEFSSYYSLSIKNRASGTYLNFGGDSTHTSLQATDGAGSATAKNIVLNPYGGNIGIGFVSGGPTEKLHVVGNIFATGNISGSSTSTGSFGRLESDTFNTTTFSSTEVTSTNLTVTGTITGSSLDVSGNIRAVGDVIAQRYIVSSSVTHLTQSFSSGSTIFGDSSDDTHLFIGSKISGSSTTTGSFARLAVGRGNTNSSYASTTGGDVAFGVDASSKRVILRAAHVEIGPDDYWGINAFTKDSNATLFVKAGIKIFTTGNNQGMRIYNTYTGGGYNSYIERHNWSGTSQDGGHLVLRNYGSGGTQVWHGSNVVVDVKASATGSSTLLTLEDSKISGSSTSTGSFGSLVVADRVQGNLTIAGSTTSIGQLTVENAAPQIVIKSNDTSDGDATLSLISDNGATNEDYWKIYNEGSDNDLSFKNGNYDPVMTIAHTTGHLTTTGSIISNRVNGVISGSSTSTGSFGQVSAKNGRFASGNDASGTISVLSGNSSQYSKIYVGTDSGKATIGVAGGNGHFFSNTLQNDLIVRQDASDKQLHLGVYDSNEKSNITISNTATTIHVDNTEQLTIQNNKISGSSTSTGSFGHGYFNDRIDIHSNLQALSAGDAMALRAGNGHISIENGYDLYLRRNGGAVNFNSIGLPSGATYGYIKMPSDTQMDFYAGNGVKLSLTQDNKISGSASSTGSFGAVAIGKATADNQRALTVVGNAQFDNNAQIYFKRSNGTADPYISYDSSNNFNIFNPVAGEIKFAIGSGNILDIESTGIVFNGSKSLTTHNSSGVITVNGNSGVILKSGTGGGSGPIQFMHGTAVVAEVTTAGFTTGDSNGYYFLNPGQYDGAHTAGLGWNKLQLGNNGANNIVAGQHSSDSNAYLDFYTDNTTHPTGSIDGKHVMRMDASANVNIYSGSLILTGNDSGNISGSSTSTGSFGRVELAGKSSTNSTISVQDGVNNGILRLQGSTRVSSPGSYIQLYGPNGSYGSAVFNYGYNQTHSELSFQVDGNERVRFGGLGEIEARSITTTHNISGSSTSTGSFGRIILNDNAPIIGNDGVIVKGASASTGVNFRVRNGSGNDRFRVHGYGAVGIGGAFGDAGETTLHIRYIAADLLNSKNEYIRIEDNSNKSGSILLNSNGCLGFQSQGGTTSIEANGGGVGNFTVAGKVHIGSSSTPAEALVVVGNVSASADSTGSFGAAAIGLASPGGGSKLNIRTSSNSSYPLLIEGDIDNDGGYTGIQFGWNGNNYNKAAIHIEGTSGNVQPDLHFLLDSAGGGDNVDASTDKKMSIFNDGTVEFPVANQKISGSSTSTGSFGRVQATSISASLYQGQIGSRYVHSQTSDSATWTINHNIGHKYPVVTVYDDSDQMILPQNGVATDSDTFTLTFNEAIQGKAVVSVGGIGENAGANYIFTQGASSTNWRVTHSLSQQYPNVTVYDENNQVIIPESITAASDNEMDITFSDGQSGYANFSIGSGIPNISAENAGKVLKVRTGGQGVEWSPTSNDVSGSMSVSGSITPTIDNFHDLGSATHRWANLYTGDIQLSNEGSEGNEVDGTTGSWTIQEGEDDLYLLNRKNGKKYKFKLEEIT